MSSKKLKISQSFIKDALTDDPCPQFLKFKYVDGMDTIPSTNQFYGLYFEYHLLGGCRGGKEPQYEPLKGGGKPKPIQDVDVVIAQAKSIMQRMGINISGGQVQAMLETDSEKGALDLFTDDFLRPERKAVYDVKFTETKVDDRWHGWGDVENDPNARIQPRHYVKLAKDALGLDYYPPFYYFVFGKSGWVRVIKVEITEEGLEAHKAMTELARTKANSWASKGWKAAPEYNKCTDCAFNLICTSRASLPTVEIIEA